MKKLAIILDSFTARSKKEIEANENFYYLSLQLDIDGTMYKSGNTGISEEKMMKMVADSKNVKTSLPTPADMENIFKELAFKYETVIYFPLSSSLSGTSNAAKVLSREYKNIHIIDSIMVGKGFVNLAKYLMKESKKDLSSEQILKLANEHVKKVQGTFIIPKNMDRIIKSGRIGRISSTILSSIHAVPIILLDSHERLQRSGIKRSGKKAITYAAEKLLNLKREKGLKDYIFLITHAFDQVYSKIAKEYLESRGQIVVYEKTAAIIMANVGDGAFSMGLIEKL